MREERDAEIARRYRAGESLAAIGRRLGISAEGARGSLIRAGVVRRPHGLPADSRTRATPEQIAQILRLRGTGASIRAIAAALGLGKRRVTSALRYHGDTTNPRHVNRPGQPRVCTRCLRSERDGAVFTPGQPANRCGECVAAATRAWHRRKAERDGATRG